MAGVKGQNGPFPGALELVTEIRNSQVSEITSNFQKFTLAQDKFKIVNQENKANIRSSYMDYNETSHSTVRPLFSAS
jgi:hypothetical protein